MSDIPADIMATAISVSDAVSFGGYEQNALSIARAILAERERHGWQPIETAPKDGTIIDLLTVGGSVAHDEWFIDEDGEAFWSCDFDDKFITHWRPIPTKP